MEIQGRQVRIGTSGFHYDHWKVIFYPKSVPKTKWLEFYAHRFDTVEINNTFYKMPEKETFIDWRQRATPGFLFALKYSRYGTHLRYLAEPRETLNYFMERAEQLGDRLGPILVQLPPRWKINLERLSAFLGAASAEYRWTVEFREPSWLCEETYNLLRKHNAALCLHDRIVNHPRVVTADWAYLRFHGGDAGGNYSDEYLANVGKEIQGYIHQGMDVYAYFNNDWLGYALNNAKTLIRMVQGE